MPMQNDPQTARKGFLYMLPLIVAGIALNLLFNQEARSLVGLKPGKTLSLKGLFGGSRARSPAAQPVQRKPLAFSADEMRAFTESFTKTEVKVLVLPPDLKKLEEERRKQREADEAAKITEQEFKKKQEKEKEEERARRLAEEERLKSTPWPVPVQGTFKDSQGRWTVIIAGRYCQPGKELVSDRTNRCAYTILSVGRKCLWLHAYRPDQPRPPILPDIEWPDVALIETAREGVFKRGYVPTNVVLANGQKVRKGDTLVYPASAVQFKIADLWNIGVVFEAVKGDQSAKIACMLVGPP